MLVHWDGFTLGEAAAHVRVSESTMRTHYQRARTALALTLTETHENSTSRPAPQ